MKYQKGKSSTWVIILVVVILFLLGGYFYLNNRGSAKVGGPASNLQKTNGNVFTSIQDALSKSLSLQCNYPNKNGGGNTSVYIKGGAVRIMGYATANANQGQPQYGQALMKGGKIYIWDDKTKQGMMMSFNLQEMMKNAGSTKVTAAPQQATNNQGGDFLKGLEQYKNYCKAAVVSDSYFTAPTDVKFVDFQQQIKNNGVDYQKTMQQYQQQAPAGQ